MDAVQILDSFIIGFVSMMFIGGFAALVLAIISEIAEDWRKFLINTSWFIVFILALFLLGVIVKDCSGIWLIKTVP